MLTNCSWGLVHHFRGLSYNEVFERFEDVYPQHCPVTAYQSPVFPNLTKFEDIFQLSYECQANPTIKFSGFNLADEIVLEY